ncbi:MAG: hypothetical protein U1F13_05880 [Acinetobacter parvus]
MDWRRRGVRVGQRLSFTGDVPTKANNSSANTKAKEDSVPDTYTVKWRYFNQYCEPLCLTA